MRVRVTVMVMIRPDSSPVQELELRDIMINKLKVGPRVRVQFSIRG